MAQGADQKEYRKARGYQKKSSAYQWSATTGHDLYCRKVFQSGISTHIHLALRRQAGMDYEMYIAAEMDNPILTSDISLLDVTCDQQGRYLVESAGSLKYTFNMVGRLEWGMSPMAHILVSQKHLNPTF